MPGGLARRLVSGWRALRHGAALDRELARELEDHLQDQIEDNMRRGMRRDEALRAARRQFGALASIEEECREARGISTMDNIVRDLTYGWRALARQPMLLAAATASIALGVAANLTVYALATALLLAVPSADRPEDLVHVRTGNGSHVSYAAWRALHASGAVAGLAGHSIEDRVNLRQGGATVSITPLVVTPNFFDLVGMPIAEGRGFTTSEADRDPHLAVVSDVFRRRYLSEGHAVGAAITINGASYTVTGVLPAGARSLPGYGIAPDIYVPATRALLPAIDRLAEPVIQLVGRLHDGQTAEQAREAVAAAAVRFGEEAGDREVGGFISVGHVGGIGQLKDFSAAGAFFIVLLVVSLLVLLIACANVAGLLIARSVARRREIAMRLALGASRGRLVQQLLTESLLLAVCGSAAGLALTWAAGQVLSRISLPLPLPISIETAFDLRLLTAAAALVLFTTFVCGLVPALQATRANLLPSMRREAAPQAGGRMPMRRLLVVGQVTVSVLLLVVATLFLRNLQRSTSMDPGFDTDGVFVAQVAFVEGRQGTAGARTIARVAERVRGIPSVAAVAIAQGVPLTLHGGSWNGTDLTLGSGPAVHVEFARNVVGPGYFRAMGIAIRGREFHETDRGGAPRVLIVNEEFARRYFGDVNPIGQTISDPRENGGAPASIVGVASNSKYRTLGESTAPALYDPITQSPESDRLIHLVVRAAGTPQAIVPAVRQAVLDVDPSAAVAVELMSSALEFAFLPSRVGAALLGTLGALGTVLAMVGLYGILSFTVSRRTHEIGLRMSLGASRGAILRLVVGEAGVMVAVGIGIGLGLALLVTQPLAAFLVAGLSPADPASLAATAGLLMAVSLFTAWGPVRRAVRIDPARALRCE